MTETPPESPEPDVYEFGPGFLTIGATGEEIDISCLVNSAKITPSKNQSDSTTKLCGTIRPGKVTYTYALSGNMDLDVADESGFFALGGRTRVRSIRSCSPPQPRQKRRWPGS